MVQKIKKILVPLDGSKYSFKALDMAITLAKEFGASIVGLCAIPLEPPIYMPGMPSHYKKRITEGAKKFLEEAKKISEQNQVEFKYYIAYENPTKYVAEFANNREFDLIVVGSHGHGAVRELLLGSVAHSTIHRAKIPVLVIK
ncbi:MAG: universal stress protein [Thaumarchaeota archaeon]|nr:universal stress protein [Nitrososphaerota archaeon]